MVVQGSNSNINTESVFGSLDKALALADDVQVALFDSLDVFWTRPTRCLKHFGAWPWREARIALFWRARTG